MLVDGAMVAIHSISYAPQLGGGGDGGEGGGGRGEGGGDRGRDGGGEGGIDGRDSNTYIVACHYTYDSLFGPQKMHLWILLHTWYTLMHVRSCKD